MSVECSGCIVGGRKGKGKVGCLMVGSKHANADSTETEITTASLPYTPT